MSTEPAVVTTPPEAPVSSSSPAVFALAIFLSAFLLFQIQLMYAKFLLPWFGGTSAVWGTCLVYFQTLLLAGYAYAHAIARWPLRRQAVLHLTLLVAAVVAVLAHPLVGFDWIFPGLRWEPLPDASPIAGILLRLTIGIGVPFLVLAATAPLLQSWYARLIGPSEGRQRSPYWLYALSNAGSMLALLTYPVLFEPILRLRPQSLLWMALFVFFALCCASCAMKAFAAHGTEAEEEVDTAAPISVAQRLLWFGLAAVGSALLLATTNILTQDVAPIPLLWVLPLAIYLFSYVFVFAEGKLYQRGLFHPALVLALIAAVIAVFRGTQMSIAPQIAVYLSSLFVVCTVLHGELARAKPEAASLTSFYLMIAAGGAFGGAFVSLIAPVIFPAIWEYRIVLMASGFAIAIALVFDRDSWLYDPEPEPGPTVALMCLLAALPLYLLKIEVLRFPPAQVKPYTAMLLGLSLLATWLLFSGGPKWMRRREFRWNQVSVITCLVLLSWSLITHLTKQDGTLLRRERNFYGALSVRGQSDSGVEYNELMHGRITHGLQLKRQRDFPTTYYDRDSGVGLAITNHPLRLQGMRVGVVGLGAGTIAAYARPDDVYRFYEINPAVIRLAKGEGDYFTFLKSAKGEIQVVPGDARLSLEAEARRNALQGFDVLVIDAFNGDSIPVHLLTREAFEIYRKHLAGPESVIAVHVSNIAVNLDPVVAGLAEHFGMKATKIETKERSSTVLSSHWILMTNGRLLQMPAIRSAGLPMLRTAMAPPKLLWTDDYSNIISLLED
jgi:spermidine synthase